MTNFPIPIDNFSDLVSSCISFYEETKNEDRFERIRAKRARLSVFAEAFHKDAGTLTALVQKRLANLKNGHCLVLMTAHQPNFFAYSGVLRKATLNFVLAKKLEELLGIPVVNFFGIADQDFADDRWVKSTLLPDVERRGGLLELRVDLPEKLMLNRVAKPSRQILSGWQTEIEKWLTANVKSVERLCRELDFKEVDSSSLVSKLHENFVSFWDIVEECHERAVAYSDFNAFLMSKIVNAVWGYDTIFSRFSDCQQAFTDEFCYLLANFKDYSQLLKKAAQEPHPIGISDGVTEQEPFLVPFWYHCDCGGKVKLLFEEKCDHLFGNGDCVKCYKHFELTFGTKNNPAIQDIASRLSARAISMALVFFKGLMPVCYIGGAGGIGYLIETRHVAKGLGIAFPPIACWRPHDIYIGLGQATALLTSKRICENLGASNLSSASAQLKHRLTEVDGRLNELDLLKKELVEKLRLHPNDNGLKKKIKEISLNQNEIRRLSNFTVLNHELKIVENVSAVLTLIPSIIDYAVNLGLKETSAQWIRYLNEDGCLSSEVYLESPFSQRSEMAELLIH